MIDPDKLYFSSAQYRNLLNEIQDGINLQGREETAGNLDKACELGLKVWDNILKLLAMLQAKSVYELDGVTGYDLLHWASCLAIELGNATRDNKLFALKKLQFCQSFVQMHQGLLDKEVRNLGGIRSSLAESYFAMGEVQKGDALFKEWLDLEPDWGWGWIFWSDCFWLMKYAGVDIDFIKAEKILTKGLSIPNISDKKYIQERLQDLLEEKESQG
jgi:tetratricopeptide (TPR) repeat protein